MYGGRTGDAGSVEIGPNDIHSTCISEITTQGNNDYGTSTVQQKED